MEKFILANNYGKDFITHKDQEQNFLKFEGFSGEITKVTGEEDKINNWSKRVGGTEIKKSDANTIILAEEKLNKLRRIKDLKDELLILEKNVQ